MAEIGDKVIVRSNENDPTLVGIFKGHERFNARFEVPIVTVGNVVLLCMSIVVPFDEELLKKLESFSSGREAWGWLAKECQEKRVERIH